MEVTVTEAEGFSHLKPEGRIDSSTAAAFEQALIEQLAGQQRSVLVDLSGVDFVSSAGLRVFLLGAKKAKGTPFSMVLCEMDENVRKVFAMSGFDRILTICDDVAAGRAMLAA